MSAMPDPLEVAIRAGAAKALRTRAAAQRQKVADGTSPIEGHSIETIIRSPEAALAFNLADGFERIADDLERGAR
jgi:hypothetical protein